MRRLSRARSLALVRNRPGSLRVTRNRKVPSDCSRCRSHGVGVICRSACSVCLLYFCPWRGRRDEPSVHARDRERPCVAKDRHPSLSVPIHGGRLEASGSSRPCTSYSSCRRADRCQARAPQDPDRRREIIWWTHDVAGAGCCAFTKGSRPRVCRLSAAPGEQALRHARRPSRPDRHTDAFHPGRSRRAGRREGSCSQWFKVSAPAPFFKRSKVPIILSTSSRGRDARTNKRWMSVLDGLAGWIMGVVDGDR